MSDDNKWSKADSPPPPMFFGEKEKNLVKQVNDEIIERVVGQQSALFSIGYRAHQLPSPLWRSHRKNLLTAR